MHNIDNILRPGTYHTPVWIVSPVSFFSMDLGFFFGILVASLGVWYLVKPRKLIVILHSCTTSAGMMHYMTETISSFARMLMLQFSLNL